MRTAAAWKELKFNLVFFTRVPEKLIPFMLLFALGINHPLMQAGEIPPNAT